MKSTIPRDEQECQQDALERIHSWLSLLEQRVLLLQDECKEMPPHQREAALARHLSLMVRMLQQRQLYVVNGGTLSAEQLLQNILLQGSQESQ